MQDRIVEIIKKAEEFRQKSKYREALHFFKKALSVSKKKSNLNGVLDSTIAIADICRITGNFHYAISNYNEALEICDALCDELSAADSMVGLGLSFRALGMWKEAVKFSLKARRIYEMKKDKRGIAFAVWAEAGALRVGGSVLMAIEKFKESKDIFSSVKYTPGVAYALC